MKSAPTLDVINVMRAQEEPEILKPAIGYDSDIFFPEIHLVS